MRRNFLSRIQKSSAAALLLLATTPALTAETIENRIKASEYQASGEEAFFIRRIAEFWKDGDFAIVKMQIQAFLNKYPKSGMNDYLLGILGDLYIQEGKFQDAADAYRKVSAGDVKEKIIINKLQALYELSCYSEMVAEGSPYLHYTTPELTERKQEFQFLMGEAYYRQVADRQAHPDANALFEKARGFYEQLLDSPYAEVSTFALADICRRLEDNKKGSELYIKLAERHPEKKESLLFNAGLLTSHIDKEKALQLFDEVIQIGGTRAHEASFNKLILSFQTERFSDVVDNYRSVYPYVPNEQMGTFNFIVAKSHYVMNQYDEALSAANKYLAGHPAISDQYKDALIIQMSCARQTGNEELFKTGLNDYEKAFPGDAELGKAYFIHAMLCKGKGNFASAEQDLAIVIEKHPSFKDRETLLYEYGITTYQTENWDKSYRTLRTFLTDYPQSERSDSAWRYYLSTCLSRSKVASSEYGKDKLLVDLGLVLGSSKGLTEEETREYKLLYSRLAYEQSCYNEALGQLASYMTSYKDHISVGEAHFLSALCLNKKEEDLAGFCTHLEAAMEVDPASYDTSSIHIQLYNGYISLAQKVKNKEEIINKAAEHLYTAVKNPQQEVKLENRLWLGGHYYSKVKGYLDENWKREPHDAPEIMEAFNRSLQLYTDIFTSLKISAFTSEMEPEMLKYAELLGVRHATTERLKVLQYVIEKENLSSKTEWKFRRQALYELAQTYEEIGDKASALETYSFLVAEAKGVSSDVVHATNLRLARLRFDQLPSVEKSEKNPAVLEILNELKEVQIKKLAQSEPLHLEAALEYAEIRSIMASSEVRDSRYLFFLTRMKEDYNSKEDAIGKTYHVEIVKNEKKRALYTSYMNYVDSEIYRLQAKQLRLEGKTDEAAQYQQKSASSLSLIKEPGQGITWMLEARISKAESSLEQK